MLKTAEASHANPERICSENQADGTPAKSSSAGTSHSIQKSPDQSRRTSEHSRGREEAVADDQCGKCRKTFFKLKTYLHILPRDAPHLCERCKIFAQSSTGMRHSSGNSGERPAPCEKCAKILKFISKFKKHMRQHKKKKTHTCDICSKTLSTKASLKRHQRVHGVEKTHTCDTCKVSFSTKKSLTKHLRQHAGKKDFATGSQLYSEISNSSQSASTSQQPEEPCTPGEPTPQGL